MKPEWNTVYAERLRKEATDKDLVEFESDPETRAELLRRLQEGENAKKALEKVEKYLGESLERLERFMKEAESGEEKG